MCECAQKCKESPIGLVANVLDWKIIVRDFEVQSYNYSCFLAYALLKSFNFLIPSIYELNITTTDILPG